MIVQGCATTAAEENINTTPTADVAAAETMLADTADTSTHAVESVTQRETVEPAPAIDETATRPEDGMEMVRIPAGEVWIGCVEENETGFICPADELPLHQVRVSEYWIDQYEVSNAQFALCVQAGACQEPYYRSSATHTEYYGNASYGDFPRVGVSWLEAQDYCQWVGGRLPTEAEWVRAARGDDQRIFPWGDDLPTCQLANGRDGLTGTLCRDDTAAVGSFPRGASPFGVMDMAGNVWEWTADWYHTDYYAVSPLADPQGPEQGGTKVVHGGGFDYSWDRLRVAYTSDHDPREHKISFGFRCVMDGWE